MVTVFKGNNRRIFARLPGVETNMGSRGMCFDWRIVVLLAWCSPALAEAPRQFVGEKAGQQWDGNGLNMKFCWCPPGKFTMGSPTGEADRGTDENQVQVQLTQGFWLGKHEVTQGDWEGVMDTRPWEGDARVKVKEGRDYPATVVSRSDIHSFCWKLTKQEREAGRLPNGWEYRLPTEAQWEYACRAGSKGRFSFDESDAELDQYAWFTVNANDVGEKYAHAVGLKRPNAWGLHDMHGNVAECCRDFYAGSLRGGRDPVETTQDLFFIDRGGDWSRPASFCRSAKRMGSVVYLRSNYLGFRLAVVPVGG